MAELELAALERDEARLLGGLEVAERDPERRGRAREDSEVAGVARGREHEHATGGLRQPLDAAHVGRGDARGDRNGPRERAGGQAPGIGCELEQRERVAARGGVEALGDLRSDVRRPQERRGVGAAQPADPQHAEVGAVEQRRLALAYRKDERDRVGDQPPGREQQRLGARPVEEVGVVHQQGEGRLLGTRGQQAQRRRPDREAVLGCCRPER
jgi:hypothetical protein